MTQGKDITHRREVWQSPLNRLLVLVIAGIGTLLSWLWLRSDGWGAGLSFSLRLILLVLFDFAVVWCCLYVLFRPCQKLSDLQRHSGPIPPEAYADCGLGALADDADPQQLYLDQVKRSVCNLIYQDPPFFFYDTSKRLELATGFDLLRRVNGEDSPSMAHTMVGSKRLDHLQFCIEDVLSKNIPGDLIETGSFRGGATIFMRAVLKAHQIRDRRVFVCDLFALPAKKPPLPLMPIYQALAAIPILSWQRRYFLILQRFVQKGFPDLENPSDDIVRFLMWNLRNPVGLNHVELTQLDVVKSNFARYGLLDDQVVFLQGFFADTLPNAPYDDLAIVRLDGDTYESTWDAITVLYPKLSQGGYIVVDDYRTFTDCQQAVDEYRRQYSIREEIQPIDDLSVFWRKEAS
jgi:hypothetical protein